jgi:MFS family permease
VQTTTPERAVGGHARLPARPADATGRETVVANRSRYARLDALAATAALWFLGKFLRYAFPPLFGTLGDTYSVSRTVLGSAFTGFMLVYAVMQFPSGVLADRVGTVRTIAAGALATGVGALALVVDSPFPVLVGAMLVMGGGTGVHKTVSVNLLSRVYPARTGRALGVFDTTGSLAGVAAPAAVVVVTGLPAVLGAPWRTLYLVGGVACLGLAAAVIWRVPRRLADVTTADPGSPVAGDATGTETTGADGRDGTSDGTAGELRQYLALFARPRFSTFVVVTALYSFAYNGVVAFLPLFLAVEAGLPPTTANLLYSSLFAVSLVQLATGDASDRLGVLPMLVATLALATVGLAATLALAAGGASAAGDSVLALSTGSLTLPTSTLVLGGAVVAFGIGAHGYRPVRGAYLMELLPDRVAGGGLGAVRTLLMIGGAGGPAVVGYLSEVAGFRAAFGLLVVAFAVASGLTALLWLLE